MRITIEMTDAETRSATIEQPIATTQPATQASGEGPPIDGGAAPETLLVALGARSEVAAPAKPSRINEDAGEPPRWLVDAIAVGAGRRLN
jgi:hypothetical protein